LISVDQALDKILNNIHVLETEERPLLETLGQVLAEDVVSGIDVPPADNSAMDGYAVRAADIEGASQARPRVLKVIDMVSAGAVARHKLKPGTAIRIMTGAPTPEGSDAVVAFEETDETSRPCPPSGIPSEIGILKAEKKGSNIRLAGESVCRGAKVLARGTLIRPSEIGVLASIGCAKIKVIRRPVVAILATGDEIIGLGESLPEGKIYNSNTYSVAAQVAREGGIPRLLGIAQDNEPAVVAKIGEGLDADLLVTIGGVSKGDYDLVKNVLAKQGEIVFWQVRSKPGKPLAFGNIRRMGKGKSKKDLPHLGLAGNAVSSMVNYELFVRPAILKMLGRKNLAKPTIEAFLDDDIKNEDGRRVFARVIVEEKNGHYHARLTGPQGSGILTSMTLANGLAIVPEETTVARKGEPIQVMMLDWSQDL
jgi:molybdopterin molybdotransferase